MNPDETLHDVIFDLRWRINILENQMAALLSAMAEEVVPLQKHCPKVMEAAAMMAISHAVD